MKNILSTDDENKMTLDDLCYKDLKVYLTKTKDNDSEDIKHQKNNTNEKRNFEGKIIKNTFRANENFDTWLITGKQNSGKTTFINCLTSYIIGVKFEENYRYTFDKKKGLQNL